MVQANPMRDCHQIQRMMSQCQMNILDDEPFLCRTAKKYYAMCLSGERK